jgi:hypothetical protein
MKHFIRAIVLGLALVLIIGLFVMPDAVQAQGDCSGSLAPRLAVGDTGYVVRSYSSLRSTPGGPAFRIMYNGATFTVVEGPVCANGLVHFRVDYGNGIVGWAAESQRNSIYGNNLYWLAPTSTTTPTPTPSPTPSPTPNPGQPANCAGSLAPRLSVGQQGVVARDFSSLRTAPAGPVFRIIPGGTRFTVLEGPVCAGYGTLTWYRIDYGAGLVGWASESERYSIYGNNLYWLAPLS